MPTREAAQRAAQLHRDTIHGGHIPAAGDAIEPAARLITGRVLLVICAALTLASLLLKLIAS
ncbi:hypothetical protein [Streptomyces lasiicapitis]|uniref:hypothetical protein n=1 Tax=Streptomyces lasiicapitis TaxID=1923961 RepID=UPI0016646E1C|nr:hypothetical protein [Streptomyces lasiicapitis]